MFFKDIDSWNKKKLALVTLIVGILYLFAACVLPCIFIGINYELFGQGHYRLTGAGLIAIVLIITFGGKAIKTLFGFIPRDSQKGQVIRFSLEMVFSLIVPALCLWGIYLIQKNVDLACHTATQCIISIMVAIVIENVALKTLTYQWQCMSEVGHKKKINRIEKAQMNQ